MAIFHQLLHAFRVPTIHLNHCSHEPDPLTGAARAPTVSRP